MRHTWTVDLSFNDRLKAGLQPLLPLRLLHCALRVLGAV